MSVVCHFCKMPMDGGRKLHGTSCPTQAERSEAPNPDLAAVPVASDPEQVSVNRAEVLKEALAVLGERNEEREARDVS